MISVFFGAASSGKSDLAEDFSLFLANYPIIYLATLYEDEDRENRARIRKHQSRRSGLPYETLLVPTAEEGRRQLERCRDKTVLLDCLGVMAANSKYIYLAEENEYREQANDLVEKDIVDYIFTLSNISQDLIIVSPDVFSSASEELEESSRRYLRLLANINRCLHTVLQADFIEVKAALPSALICKQEALTKFLERFK